LQDLFDCIEADDIKSFESMFEAEYVNSLHPSNLFDDKFTWGLLHASCYFGRMKFIEILMENKADVELADTWYGGRPLAWATFGKHPKICKALIEKYGADRNARNNHGQTAFDLVEDKNSIHWREFFKVELPKRTAATSVTIKIPPQSEKPKPATQVYQTPMTQRFVIPATIRPPTGSRKVIIDPRTSKSYGYTPAPVSVPTPTQDMFQQFLKTAQILSQELLVESVGKSC
jgi:hypothetical protein